MTDRKVAQRPAKAATGKGKSNPPTGGSPPAKATTIKDGSNDFPLFGTATTLEEFISLTLIASANSPNRLWFRGHSKSAYRLRPNLFRDREEKPEGELRGLEENLNRKFRDRAIPLHFSTLDDGSLDERMPSWRRLFTMQHYGAPTRLLDWSENALTALCFAVLKQGTPSTEGADVWILDPHGWNARGNDNHSSPMSIDDHEVSAYSPLPSTSAHIQVNWPIAVNGIHNNPRISRQQGTFVIFAPGKPDSMEQHYVRKSSNGASECLHRIRIPQEAILTISNALESLGFNNFSLYPDLHGLALDLKQSIQEA